MSRGLTVEQLPPSLADILEARVLNKRISQQDLDAALAVASRLFSLGCLGPNALSEMLLALTEGDVVTM